MSNDHPLGTPNPDPVPDTPAAVSIVDSILNLDELLSADVRRAEKMARFCTKSWLEADIDELQAELERLTDNAGNPIPVPDRALGDTTRTAEQVALELQAVQAAYGQAFRSVRMRQVSGTDWTEFKAKHRVVLDAGAPYGDSFWNDLIAVTAHQPKMTVEQVAELRGKLGDPQMDELAQCAWAVNTSSGVSIPKSLLSSHVLKRAAQGRS